MSIYRLIQRQVFYHETIPVYFPGARYDYRQATLEMLKQEPTCLPTLPEEGSNEEEQQQQQLNQEGDNDNHQLRSILKKPASPSRVQKPYSPTYIEQVEC